MRLDGHPDIYTNGSYATIELKFTLDAEENGTDIAELAERIDAFVREQGEVT